MKRNVLATHHACILSMLLVCTAAVCGNVSGGVILFVDDDAPTGGNGTSWNNAIRHLADALQLAEMPINGVTEIRVAQGTYYPDRDMFFPTGTELQTDTFRLVNGVSLKGGYAGVLEPSPDVRDTNLYESILSGDLLQNDVPGADFIDPSFNDNSVHVVTGSGLDLTAVIDGLVITKGMTERGAGGDNQGGGMIVIGGSPTITNCKFIENRAEWGGGCSVENPIVHNR